ncbi:hypothetical protein HY632_01575 [Candidatus Uhrbacteria bacterium]|nr:hypothetical protein [Candidatus Uhrbacteria bacterium]
MRRSVSTLVAILAMGIAMATPMVFASGPNIMDRLTTTGGEAGYNTQNAETSLSRIVGRIVNAATSVVGVVFVAQMVYAGYLWMTAAGEKDQFEKAQKIIRRSVVGLAILLSAWAITYAVLTRLYQATG